MNDLETLTEEEPVAWARNVENKLEEDESSIKFLAKFMIPILGEKAVSQRFKHNPSTDRYLLQTVGIFTRYTTLYMLGLMAYQYT